MFVFQSIHKRLALEVSLASLGFALVIGFISFSIEYKAQYKQANELQDQLVATVHSSASVAAFAGNQSIAAEVTAGLLANPIIAGAHILSTSGFSYQDKKEGSEFSDDTLIKYPLLSPIDKTSAIGQLGVQQNSTEIHDRAIKAALRYSALLILQIIISAGLLMLLFDRVIGRPLTNVAHMLEQVPPGSNSRLSTPSDHENDEIGMLVQSSNILLDAIEQALIDERKLKAEVDEMEINYRRIFDTTNVGIMRLHPSGRLINCNPTLLSRILVVTFDAASASACDNFVDAIFQDPNQAWSKIKEAHASGQTIAGDLQLRSAKGERWAYCMISVTIDGEGRIELIEGVLYDVTARRERESKAHRAAEIDALTSLSNRRGMEIFLDRSIRHAAEDQVELAVMMLDLDRFKGVNDTYGHAAGDMVLKTVAERMSTRIRRSADLVARLGGDEFTVIAYDTGNKSDLLEQMALDLIQLINQPIEIGISQTVSVGTSIGIARYPKDGNNREDLLEAADKAMYSVKRSGKNDFSFAST